MLVMIVLKRCKGLSIYGVSIGGAAAHNIGQMAAACITLGNTMVLGYLPFLLAVSLLDRHAHRLCGRSAVPRHAQYPPIPLRRSTLWTRKTRSFSSSWT